MATIALKSQRFEEFQADEDDQVLFNEVVATLNDLGHYNRVTNKYQLNLSDHSVCLRDLIRFLRNDGPNFLVRRQMGISNIVDNDLLPIVEQHTITDDRRITETGKSLMDKIVRLLVDLTNPTVLHYPDQKIPKEDKYEMNIYLELQNFLFEYKQAFSSHKRFWVVLTKFLSRILELDSTDRQVEDDLMMERIIILVRNVLHIPIAAKGKETQDSNVHDRIIEQMNNSGLLDIFQYMISLDEYNQYCFHLLEIIFLIYREQNAEFLAKSVGSDRRVQQQSISNGSQISSIGRSQYEKECDRKEFEDARNRDRQEYLQMMAKFKSDDYTRFKETAFVIKNMKAVSDRDMICYRAYSNPEKAIDFNKNKIAQRRPRNRRPMKESVGNSDSLGVQRIHCSSKELRSILYDFGNKFLSESYNRFMTEIRANLSRGVAQEHDETYYLWASQFFMEFNRNRQSDVTREQKYQQVYEILSTSTFHYIQTTVDNYMDHLLQKKEFKNELADWSKRLHQALRTYRELLFSLSHIESLNLPAASKMCYRIKNDIFTEPEYREMLLRLMQAYNEEKMSKAYLRDLIETNHLFLKMLEYHAKISLDFKVKVKKRKINRRKKDKNTEALTSEEQEENSENVELSSDQIWLEIMDEVAETLNNTEELNAQDILGEDLLKTLFDPLSNQNLDEQKLSIMEKINEFLTKKQVKQAIVLYREARNVLAGVDDDHVFGEIGIEIDDEMLALNGILTTEFKKDKKTSKNKDKQDDEEDSGSDQADDCTVIQEKAFTIEDTLKRYAHPTSVRACRLLLNNYRINSAMTNHAIVRLLYRIAVDLKMKPMFYNLNYFLLFEQIMDDPILKNPVDKNCPRYKSICELEVFSRYIMRSFFKLLSKHPKIASEICFIANSREAYQMEYGFDEQVVTQMIREKKGIAWSEAQILELEVLYKEYNDKASKEMDVVDYIQEHLIDETKTRRQIINQLKKMDLLQISDIKKNNYKGSPWSEEEVVELKNLYERFKDNLEFEEENFPSDPTTKENPPLTTMIEVSTITDSQRERELNDQSETEPLNDLTSEVNKSDKKLKKKSRKRLDIIDCILKHLSTSEKRNRRQIIRQLKILNIYDYSASKKWNNEKIEELRSVFCNLFIDFKEFQSKNSDCDNVIDGDNYDIITESQEIINKDNFMEKLLEKFSDKTKSTRQIMRQLRKMDFTDSLRTIGIIKDNKSNSESNEADEMDSSSDDEDKNQNNDEEDQVIIQYDDEDEEEFIEISEQAIKKQENKYEFSIENKEKLHKNRERLKKMASSLVESNDQNDDDYSVHDLSDKDNEDDDTLSTVNVQKSFRKIQTLVSDSEDNEDDDGDPEPRFMKTFNDEEHSFSPNENDNHSSSKRKLMINSDDEDDDIIDEQSDKKKKKRINVIDDDDDF